MKYLLHVKIVLCLFYVQEKINDGHILLER